MLKYRIEQVRQQKPKTFDEFHALICKSMPDVIQHPEMYHLCYNLMRLAWDAAKDEEMRM